MDDLNDFPKTQSWHQWNKKKKIFAEFKGFKVCRIDLFSYCIYRFFPAKTYFSFENWERKRTLLETKPICRQNLTLYLNIIYLSKCNSSKTIKNRHSDIWTKTTSRKSDDLIDNLKKKTFICNARRTTKHFYKGNVIFVAKILKISCLFRQYQT